MAHQDDRSVQQIKAETERSRARLTDTVEQLRASVSETADEVRQRISPSAIKAEVSGYLKSRGEQLMDDMTSTARNNPMQAVAIGAAVGYPLLKIARAIPLPVLMIGAGLFLTSTKRGQALVRDTRDYASDLTDQTVQQAQRFGGQVSRTMHDMADQGAEVADRARNAVMGQVGQVGDTLSSATSAAKSWANQNAGRAESSVDQYASRVNQYASGVGSQADGMRERASNSISDMTEQASRGLRDSADAIRQTAASAATSIGDAAASATTAARQVARDVTESTMSAARRANRTIGETVEQNPLLVAGLGLVVGGIIASSLPRTDLEDDLVGSTSDDLKARAQNAATEQFDHAKTAAMGVFDQVAENMKREGLSSEGAEASAQDIAQRMRHVSEAGTATGLKSGSANNEGGGRTHG